MKTKKGIGVLLILALLLTLCGCGMSSEAKAAQELIDSIGEVTLDSEGAIAAAEEAVAALSDKDRERLTGLDGLTKAREEFNALSDADKVSSVEALIAGIGAVDPDSRSVIDAAKAAYDALDDHLKESIGNADLLAEAEAAYEEACLTAEAAPVEEAIAALGEITTDSGEAIANAKALYEALPAEAQAKVDNADLIAEAEAVYEDACLTAEAAPVEEAIAALGEITTDSGETIANAKAMYEALPAEAQAKVDNADLIAEAEAAYEEACLEAEAAPVEEAIAALGEITTDSGEAIANAKAMYDALPVEAQAKVDNAAAIGEAEAAYEDACLEAEAAPVEEAIAALGEITLDSGEAIANAKALYDALPAEVQAKVDNSEVLAEAEAALSSLRVDEAEKLIGEIGEVTLDSGEAIAAAQTAFEALTPEEAAKVGNTAVLTEAGESYQTALEDRAAELLKGFTPAEAEGRNEKIYYPAGWTFYGENPAMNQRVFIRPYIKVSDDTAQVRIVYNYTAPYKIYWTGISIYVDDLTFTKSFPEEAIVRDHSVGTVWEYCDDAADMDLLRAIAEAQRGVWFCFAGPAGLSDYRLSDTDVKAIRQTLEAYDAMLAAGVQPAA